MSKPKAPPGLAGAGRRLWDAVILEYELEEHETALLIEACRTLDLLGRLDRLVRREGPIVETPQGPRAHPAAVEARQQRIALARLLAALRLPAGDEEDAKGSSRRPQRRVGPRGVYAVRGAL